VVKPGETVVVYLSVSGQRLDAAKIAAQAPIRDSEVLTAPPYQFSVTIPTRITPGPYALTAEGGVANLGLRFSAPVSIDVERSDSPLTIATDLSFLELPIGGRSGIRVLGTYTDGSRVDLRRSAQTAYMPQAPGIVSVSVDGLFTGVAPGSTTVVVRHQNLRCIVTVTVTRNPK
jgi:hypothetical protein